MQRREFIGLIGGAAFRPLAARGEQSRRVPVVGILWHAGSAEEEAAFSRPLKAGFADHSKGCIRRDAFEGMHSKGRSHSTTPGAWLDPNIDSVFSLNG
jgi:hypothetical protein